MKGKPSSKKSASPIEERKRQLAQEQEANRARLQQHEQFLQDAPKRAEELAKARREKKLESTSRTDRPTGHGRHATLPDPWRPYEINVAVPAQRKRTRAERREGRLLFVFLLLVLIGVSYVLYLNLSLL